MHTEKRWGEETYQQLLASHSSREPLFTVASLCLWDQVWTPQPATQPPVISNSLTLQAQPGPPPEPAAWGPEA